mgnify:CR=1 FL=1
MLVLVLALMPMPMLFMMLTPMLMLTLVLMLMHMLMVVLMFMVLFHGFCHYPSLHTDKKPHETLPRTQHVGAHVRRCGSANFTLYDSHASFWKMDGESSRGLWP